MVKIEMEIILEHYVEMLSTKLKPTIPSNTVAHTVPENQF